MDMDLEKNFLTVAIDLGAIGALLRATLALPSWGKCEANEFEDVFSLLQICEQKVEEAIGAFSECERAYSGLEQRIAWKPLAGDPVPDELVFGLVCHAIEPINTASWQQGAADIGKMLHAYANIHPGLAPLVPSWIDFVRKHGGDLRLHTYEDGETEVTWNGPLVSRISESDRLKMGNE